MEVKCSAKTTETTDIKNFAENTMNELLGWYGYEKVHGEELRASSPTSSGNCHSDLEDGFCAWCQKTEPSGEEFELRSAGQIFCSENCFNQCRRASFKKHKTCNWCKHIRHTANYVDLKEGENKQLQFCSEKCLNQYKMNIFCQETQQHVKTTAKKKKQDIPVNSQEDAPKIVITPDLWTKRKDEIKLKEKLHPKSTYKKYTASQAKQPIRPSTSGSQPLMMPFHHPSFNFPLRPPFLPPLIQPLGILPPNTLMTPFPFPVPLPIPIPIPVPFPVPESLWTAQINKLKQEKIEKDKAVSLTKVTTNSNDDTPSRVTPEINVTEEEKDQCDVSDDVNNTKSELESQVNQSVQSPETDFFIGSVEKLQTPKEEKKDDDDDDDDDEDHQQFNENMLKVEIIPMRKEIVQHCPSFPTETENQGNNMILPLINQEGIEKSCLYKRGKRPFPDENGQTEYNKIPCACCQASGSSPDANYTNLNKINKKLITKEPLVTTQKITTPIQTEHCTPENNKNKARSITPEQHTAIDLSKAAINERNISYPGKSIYASRRGLILDAPPTQHSSEQFTQHSNKKRCSIRTRIKLK